MPKFIALGFYPFLAQASGGVFGGPPSASLAKAVLRLTGVITVRVNSVIWGLSTHTGEASEIEI